MKAFTCLPKPAPTLQTFVARPTSTTCPKPRAAALPPRRRQQRQPFSHTAPRPNQGGQGQGQRQQPADDPSFRSVLDNPATLVRAGRPRHGPGLLVLVLIPVTAFALGTWQVFRLRWKTDLLAKCEDRIVREPLPLPAVVDPDAVEEGFDYRRVVARGRFRHDQEMLIGPRMRDGEQGYMVITPLEREGGASTVLVNRGWISKDMADQRKRGRGTGRAAELSLPKGEVVVEGMLRKPWKKNMFTPENRPDKNEFYFPDVKQMADLTGAQPVWIEATMGTWLL